MSTQEGIERFIITTEARLGRPLDDLERVEIELAYTQGVEDTIVDCIRGDRRTLGDELDLGKIH